MEIADDFDINFNSNDLSLLFQSESDHQYSYVDNHFLKAARENGLFDFLNPGDLRCTIFAPPNHEFDNCKEDFQTIWNRHVAPSKVQMDQYVVMQVRTLSNLTYGLYYDNDQFVFGGVQILACNNTCGGCFIHDLQHMLSDFRFVLGDIAKFPLVVLGYQKYELFVKAINLKQDVRIHVVFTEFGSRKIIGGVQKFSCQSEQNTQLNIEIPNVSLQQAVNFWMELVSDKYAMPLITWMRPHNIIIYPNAMQVSNPIIWEFNPIRGTKTQPMWIHGTSFSPALSRVTIGEKSAIIFECSTTLIKCIIPDCGATSEKCNVQVANGDVFVTAQRPFLYVQ